MCGINPNIAPKVLQLGGRSVAGALVPRHRKFGAFCSPVNGATITFAIRAGQVIGTSLSLIDYDLLRKLRAICQM